MDIQYFYSFIETVNQKSISKASEKLNLTHPALSKQIRKLEEYYGTSLFQRSSSGVELTESGELLYNRIRLVLTELESIKADIQNRNNKKLLRLGTIPSLAANYLPKQLLELERRGVKVEITVQDTSNAIIEQLKDGLLDAAIVEHVPVHKSYWESDLFTERFYAVALNTDRISMKDEISIAELDETPLVMYPPDCSVRKSVTKMMDELNLKPMIRTEVNFGDVLLGYVAAGAGVTIVPATTAEHLTYTSLKAISISDQDAKRTISLFAASESIGKMLYRIINQKRKIERDQFSSLPNKRNDT